MYRRILQEPLTFPSHVGTEARDLLTRLLRRDASRRLGSGPQGAQEIKSHPFFTRHIDWPQLLSKKVQPPYKPGVASAFDTSNFDPEFTSETAAGQCGGRQPPDQRHGTGTVRWLQLQCCVLRRQWRLQPALLSIPFRATARSTTVNKNHAGHREGGGVAGTVENKLAAALRCCADAAAVGQKPHKTPGGFRRRLFPSPWQVVRCGR